ncbi:intraflagellar transport protein 25 homolog [Patella vulgata]|uniref:intraflagellar transport protein 25 homolog n=1 Tax=Patella vulgata TaxID=6465 RepID=UPI002180047E|nr:intraflagellar transport protein 25 homolog [Patella vulgata]
MFDLALSEAGAQIILATSSDDKYPPENMIDGKDDTFWTTCGLYPQEFIIKFTSLVSINTIQIACYNVKKLKLEVSSDDNQAFKTLTEKELQPSDSAPQSEEIPGKNVKAMNLRVVIESGYDHFCAVYKICVHGNAERL